MVSHSRISGDTTRLVTLRHTRPTAFLIAESLEYWVEEMHVDGLRLDEGSVLPAVGMVDRSNMRRSCGRLSCMSGSLIPNSSLRRGTPVGSTRSQDVRR